MSFQDSKGLLNQFENLNNEKSTIIDIKNNICFGIYKSPLLTDVIKYLKNGSIQKAQELLEIFENLIFDTKQISIKTLEITRKYKISKTDIKIIDLIQ